MLFMNRNTEESKPYRILVATDGSPQHLVPNVQRIAPILGTTSLEEGLGIENDEGTKVLVLFKALPEIEEVSSDERQSAATGRT